MPSTRGVVIECIGKGVKQDRFGLPCDQSFHQDCQVRVLGRIGNIGQDLVRGVTKPESFNVASDDEGVWDVRGGIEDSGVQCVGKTILE